MAGLGCSLHSTAWVMPRGLCGACLTKVGQALSSRHSWDMDATTTYIPQDADQSGLEFMMDILHIEIAIYTEEKDFEKAALMCRHYLAYHEKWKEVTKVS